MYQNNEVMKTELAQNSK